MPTATVKSLAKKLKVSVNLVEERWEKAKAIAKKKFKTSDKQYYPYVMGILKNMLKSHTSTSAMFASLSADTPDWWDKMGYEDQKSYLKEHKESDLKINKKKPHNGRHDTKTVEEKQKERAGTLEPDEKVAQEDHGGGAFIPDEDLNEDDNDKADPTNDSFDSRLEKEQEESGVEVADQTPDDDGDEADDTQQDFDSRAVKNMAHVGEKAIDSDEETIQRKVHIGMGKALFTGTKAYLKAVTGGKLDDVEVKSANRLGGMVSTAMFAAIGGILLFTPAAPFAYVIGIEYMQHKMGNKDNIFDKAREDREAFLESRKKSEDGESNDENEATVTETVKRKKGAGAGAGNDNDGGGERGTLIKQRRQLMQRLKNFPRGKLNDTQERYRNQIKEKIERLDDRIDELEPSTSAEFEAWAGDDNSLIHRMSKDIYHTMLQTHLPTMVKMLRQKYPDVQKDKEDK